MKSPCLIALHLWDWGTPKIVTQEEILEFYVSEGMCNAVCIWPDHQPGWHELPLDLIQKHNLSVIMYFFTENVYNFMQSLRWGGPGKMHDYVEHWVNTIIELTRARPPDSVWWSMGHEHFDECYWWGNDPEKCILGAKQFISRQEAYEYYRTWVLTDLHKRHWSRGYLRQAQQDRIYKYGVDKDIPATKYALGYNIGIPATWPYLQQKGIDAGEIFFGAGGITSCSAHYLFSLSDKLKFYWWECTYTGTGLQPGIAFVRGAAKQYKRKWLLDHSPYDNRPRGNYSGYLGRGLDPHPVEIYTIEYYYPFWYDKDGNRLLGLTESILERAWLLGYMSGADAIFQEGAAKSHFIKVDGKLRLTPAGHAAKRFYHFASKVCPDRGTPIVPVALLMDFYHGMDPGPSYVFSGFRMGDHTWGTIPFTSGDYMANLFFDMAFPGHAMWPDRPVPWRNNQDLARLQRSGFDERPYERRIMVSSTWGDIFDVLLWPPGQSASQQPPPDCSVPHLEVYAATVLLGDIMVNSRLEETLESYVRSGGHALLNAAQLDTQNWPDRLVACMCSGSRSPATRSQWAANPPVEEPEFEVIDVTPTTDAEVVAATWHGQPIALRHRLGKGEVWLTTVPYMLGRNTNLLSISRRVFEAFLHPYTPITVEGPPLGYLVNRRDDGLLITVGNHEPSEWRGRLIVPEMAVADGYVHDLWNDRAVITQPEGKDLSVWLVLPPFTMAMLYVPSRSAT